MRFRAKVGEDVDRGVVRHWASGVLCGKTVVLFRKTASCSTSLPGVDWSVLLSGYGAKIAPNPTYVYCLTCGMVVV